MKKNILIFSSIIFFVGFVFVLQARESQNLLEKMIGIKPSITDDGYGYGYNHEYPDTPTNFSALVRNATNVILGWEAPSQEVLYYTVRYGKTHRVKQSKSVLGNRTQTKLKLLTSATKYYAKIKASNNGGSSAFSSLISFRTLPQKVKNVRVPADNITSNSLQLMWKKVIGDNIFYRLRIINTKGKIIKKITTKKTQKTVRGLEPNSLYRIKVRALYRNKLIQAGAWSDITRAWTLE